jgi:hypothetical protein
MFTGRRYLTLTNAVISPFLGPKFTGIHTLVPFLHTGLRRYGSPKQTVFRSWVESPLTAASIAPVHRDIYSTIVDKDVTTLL